MDSVSIPDDGKRYRTICYVDGFNLYYGMKDAGLEDCMWLNAREMATALVRLPFVLSNTKYFTARISGNHPGDSDERAEKREASRLRQATYLEALETLRCLEIFEGRYFLKRDFCRNCNADFHRPEEKMTDVCIATELVADAFLDRFDSAVIVSGDSDLVPPLKAIKRHFPGKRLAVAFPPKRTSTHLSEVADDVMQIWPRTFGRAQLPEKVPTRDGVVLCRPKEWG